MLWCGNARMAVAAVITEDYPSSSETREMSALGARVEAGLLAKRRERVSNSGGVSQRDAERSAEVTPRLCRLELGR
jgi:hypothetical protein